MELAQSIFVFWIGAGGSARRASRFPVWSFSLYLTVRV
jgi:hypothetical protein